MQTYRIELDRDAVEAVIQQVVYDDGIESVLELVGVPQVNMDVNTILEYIEVNDLYSDIADSACDNGKANMIQAFMDEDITNFVDVISYRTDALAQALLESSDSDIQQLVETLVEGLGYVKADSND